MKSRTLFTLASLLLVLTSCSGSASTSQEQPEVSLVQNTNQELKDSEIIEMLQDEKIKICGTYLYTNDKGKEVKSYEFFHSNIKNISIQSKTAEIIDFTADLDTPYYLHDDPIQFHYDSTPYQKTITNEEFSVLPTYPFDNQFFYDNELPIEYVVYDESNKVTHDRVDTLRITPDTVKNIEIEDEYHDDPFLRLYTYIFTLPDDTYIRGQIKVEYSPKSNTGYKNWFMDPSRFFHQSIYDPRKKVTQTP